MIASRTPPITNGILLPFLACRSPRPRRDRLRSPSPAVEVALGGVSVRVGRRSMGRGASLLRSTASRAADAGLAAAAGVAPAGESAFARCLATSITLPHFWHLDCDPVKFSGRRYLAPQLSHVIWMAVMWGLLSRLAAKAWPSSASQVPVVSCRARSVREDGKAAAARVSTAWAGGCRTAWCCSTNCYLPNVSARRAAGSDRGRRDRCVGPSDLSPATRAAQLDSRTS